MRLSEVVGALSYALDITEGQPVGHAVRSCLIGMRIASEVGLEVADRSALFYALLLKDAGCSTNSSKVAALFGADDLAYKRDRKLTNRHSARELTAHLVRNAAPGASPVKRAGRLMAVVRHGAEGSRRLTEIRCERGAEIARMCGFSEETAAAIRALDEHWDGNGHPAGLRGEEIPLLGRILGLAQTVEFFFDDGGVDAAYAVAAERAGTWFDPGLVAALGAFRHDAAFWGRLATVEPSGLLGGVAPEDVRLAADDERVDRIAEAFAKVIDAKSPFTFRHSEGVAGIAVAIGRALGMGSAALRDLRRAGLLHDIGKLGVSNLILDKPGKLDDGEWRQMRRHPEFTLRILERVACFRDIAAVAAAHHEKLDGTGYHLGVPAAGLPVAARILAVADVFEALTADRPYRAGMPLERVLGIMRADAGSHFCPTAVAGLLDAVEGPGFVARLAAPDPATSALRPGGSVPARA